MEADDRKSRSEGEIRPVDWVIGRRAGRTRCLDGGSRGTGAGVEMRYHEQGNCDWDGRQLLVGKSGEVRSGFGVLQAIVRGGGGESSEILTTM